MNPDRGACSPEIADTLLPRWLSLGKALGSWSASTCTPCVADPRIPSVTRPQRWTLLWPCALHTPLVMRRLGDHGQFPEPFLTAWMRGVASGM